jgi:hypothetical protein
MLTMGPIVSRVDGALLHGMCHIAQNARDGQAGNRAEAC